MYSSKKKKKIPIFHDPYHNLFSVHVPHVPQPYGDTSDVCLIQCCPVGAKPNGQGTLA